MKNITHNNDPMAGNRTWYLPYFNQENKTQNRDIRY